MTDPAQVAETVRAAEARFESIDVLVNNAGYGYRAAVEEGDDPDDLANLFEFTGEMRMPRVMQD